MPRSTVPEGADDANASVPVDLCRQGKGREQGPGPARLVPADIPAALAEGWDDFLARPGNNLILTAVYPVAGLMMVRAVASGDLAPLLLPLVSGFVVVGPLAAVPLYESSRRRTAGETDTGFDAEFPALWREMAVFVGPRGGALLRLGFLCIALLGLWLATGAQIHRWTVGNSPATPLNSLAAQAEMVLGTPEGRTMLVLQAASGFGIALAALVLFTFSFPRVVDGERRARSALSFSVATFRRNPGVLLLWGSTVGTIILASILLGLIGLAVTLPVCAHATWRLYVRAARPSA